jgi:hypothetical protein
MNTTLILALLFVVLVNVQIFATKEVKASYGSFLIGSIWIILIALMALAVIHAKNKFIKVIILAFIVYCLAYPYLGGFEEVRARQLSYLALFLSLLITSGIVLSGDYPILKYFVPTNIWLFIAVFFLVEK